MTFGDAQGTQCDTGVLQGMMGLGTFLAHQCQEILHIMSRSIV
jgi:hypothetical protein